MGQGALLATDLGMDWSNGFRKRQDKKEGREKNVYYVFVILGCVFCLVGCLLPDLFTS
jgi:hypothetical protein